MGSVRAAGVIGLAILCGLCYTVWPNRIWLGSTVFLAVFGVLMMLQEVRHGRSRN
ncbi:putative membrane protein [Exiguobacterium sp. 8A]|nr:putative membrane protein [Exiguobacterium sp. 8A]